MRKTRTRTIPAVAEREVTEEVTVCDCCKKLVKYDSSCKICNRDLCDSEVPWCSSEAATPNGYIMEFGICPPCREVIAKYGQKIDELNVQGELLEASWKRECIIAREKAESLAAEPKTESGG